MLVAYIVFLLALLLGCETWSFTVMEESRLRVFENRVLRRIFGPNMDEVTRQWRKIYNEELNDLYPSPNIFLVIKHRRNMCGAFSTYGGEKRCIQGYGGET